MSFWGSAVSLVKQSVNTLIPNLGVFGDAVDQASDTIKATAEKIRSYASDVFMSGGVVGVATKPKPSMTFPVTPAGKEVIKEDIAKTPVGTSIKVPFVQKEIVIPSLGKGGVLPLDEVLKSIIEVPEKIVTSLAEAPEVIKTGKIPAKPTNQIYDVPTYAEDAQNTFSQFFDLGYTAKQAAAITIGLIGSTAVLDAATMGSFLDSGTKAVLANVAPKDIEAESARQFMGLPKAYTVAEREAAYRDLAKELHPDVTGADPKLFAKVSEANTILKTAEAKGTTRVWDQIKHGARTASEKLQTPVLDLFKAPTGTPYANVKGLLPAVAGTRPEPTYNPYRRFNLGFSAEDITGGAKKLPKDENIPPIEAYDEFIPKRSTLVPVPEKALIPGQGLIDLPAGKVTMRAVQKLIKEIGTLKTALYKNRAAFVEEYLTRPEGMKILANADKFQNAPLEFDRRVVQGVKNSVYWKKERVIQDEMGRGWLMQKISSQKNGRNMARYVVVEPTAVSNYQQRGWNRVIEIDSLAAESHFENGAEYLETMMQLSGLKRFNNTDLYAHNRLMKIDPKYQELNKKITDLTKEVQTLYGNEVENIASEFVQTAQKAAGISPQEFAPGGAEQPPTGEVQVAEKPNEFPVGEGEKEADEFLEKIKDKEIPGILTPEAGPGGLTPPPLNFSEWKDKALILINRETFSRNIEDIAGKDAEKVKEYIVDPMRENETARVEWAREIREDLKAKYEQLGFKPRGEEDILTQKYGEKTITLDYLKQRSPEKWMQVVEFSGYFRDVYDSILTRWNEVRGKYGYSPIPKRTDYFRHFIELKTMTENFGLILGANDLPTEISGITDIFKPGKPFSDAELKRLGGRYTDSAIVGLDKYIDSVSKQIFHTDSVQRIRTIEKYLRDSSEAAVQRRSMSGVIENDVKALKITPEYQNAEADLLQRRITPAEWEQTPVVKKIRELQDKMRHLETLQRVHLPNFVANLTEYGNAAAGKKSMLDRSFEGFLGRKAYSWANFFQHRFQVNAVLGNLSSAFANLIAIFTQVPATTSKGPVIRGLTDTLVSGFNKEPFEVIDGIKSNYLVRLVSSKNVAPDFWQKTEKVAAFLFEKFDYFAKRSAVAAKYFENVNRGISKEAAMKIADEYVIRTFADRNIGERPAFHAAKVLGPLTNFQLEVNNFWSFYFRDIPKYSKGDKTKMFAAWLQLVVYSYAFNEIYKKVTGRRMILDPVYYVLTLFGLTNESRSLSEIDRVGKTVKELSGQVPYIGGFASGRFIPIASTIPNLFKIVPAISAGDTNTIINELPGKIFFYYVMPFGGGQAKKTLEGAGALISGSVKNASGGVRFDMKLTPTNIIRGLIFGKYSFPEAVKASNDISNLYTRVNKQTLEGTKNRLAAERLYDKLSRMDPDEANQYANTLADSNPALYDKLVDVFEEHRKDFTSADKLIKRLGVNNGERAKYIFDEIEKLKTPDEKNAYWEELDNKGLITDEVYDQIVQLLEK